MPDRDLDIITGVVQISLMAVGAAALVLVLLA